MPLSTFTTPYAPLLAEIKARQAWVSAEEQDLLRLCAGQRGSRARDFVAAAKRRAAWLAAQRAGLDDLEWQIQDAIDEFHSQAAYLRSTITALQALVVQLAADLHETTLLLHARAIRLSSTSSTAALYDSLDDACDAPVAATRDTSAPVAVAVTMAPHARTRLIRNGRCARPSVRRCTAYSRPLSPFLSSPTRSLPTPPAPPALHTHPQQTALSGVFSLGPAHFELGTPFLTA